MKRSDVYLIIGSILFGLGVGRRWWEIVSAFAGVVLIVAAVRLRITRSRW